jgi:hypothetical protein
MNNSNASGIYDGVQRRDGQLNSIVANNATLNKDHQAGYKTETDNLNAKKETKPKLNKAISEKDYAAEPSVGRIDPIDSVVFNEYLDKNLKPVNDSINKQAYRGKTILSFTVNRKGEPKDIKVETSLCAPCDAQAIRLLEKGPKWIYGGTKRRQVAIELEAPEEPADNPGN